MSLSRSMRAETLEEQEELEAVVAGMLLADAAGWLVAIGESLRDSGTK